MSIFIETGIEDVEKSEMFKMFKKFKKLIVAHS